jgi:pSer/pThr/pTyr-binding forkhead associated (FHA) protein
VRVTIAGIVPDDANVSRRHAVIIDTGTSFAIADLRSANGVQVGSRAHVRAGTGRNVTDHLHKWWPRVRASRQFARFVFLSSAGAAKGQWDA